MDNFSGEALLRKFLVGTTMDVYVTDEEQSFEDSEGAVLHQKVVKNVVHDMDWDGSWYDIIFDDESTCWITQ